MALYRPGTEERDLSKVIRSLQAVATAVDAAQAAWTSYTPTIAANAGTFTTVSATGSYLAIGKTVFVRIRITITTNGTASSSVTATLPVNCAATPAVCVLSGRAGGVSGYLLQGLISFSTPTIVRIFNYDNTYPGADGEILSVSGVYESV